MESDKICLPYFISNLFILISPHTNAYPSKPNFITNNDNKKRRKFLENMATYDFRVKFMANGLMQFSLILHRKKKNSGKDWGEKFPYKSQHDDMVLLRDAENRRKNSIQLNLIVVILSVET